MSEYWEKLMEQHAEFKAPFVCNIEFTAPSRFPKENQEVKQKNVNHIAYIGTRSGVETLDESQEKQAVDFSKDFDLEKYIKYLNQRPGSHGLFSGSDEFPTPIAIQKELESHNGVVWRVVLSLTEDDAKRLDYTSRASWETTLRATVPDAAAKMKIDESNLRWVAAYHNEVGHPHVHLVMWEKNVKRRRGLLTDRELNEVKKTFQNEVYSHERNLLFQQKTAARDLLRDLSIKDTSQIVSIIREVKDFEEWAALQMEQIGEGKVGIAPEIPSTREVELAKRINEIASQLPEKGRVVYKLMPPQLKASIDSTTKWLIEQPSFYPVVSQYYKAVELMTKQYSFQDKDLDRAIKNAKFDLEKRISQVVLRAALESTRSSSMIVNPEKAAIVVQQIERAMGQPANDINTVVQHLSASLTRLLVPDEDQIRLLKAWMHEQKLDMSEGLCETIVESNAHRAAETIEDKDISAAAYLYQFLVSKDEGLKSKIQMHIKDNNQVDSLLTKVESEIERENTYVMPERLWKKFVKHMGIESPYPWREVQQVSYQFDREKIKQGFATASLKGLTDEEIKYTSFCMAVTLKQLDFSKEEQFEIMGRFAEENQDFSLGNLVNVVHNLETNYLRKSTWNLITERLQLDIKYPWIIESHTELSTDDFQKLLRQLATASFTGDPKEINETMKQYYQLLTLQHKPEEAKLIVKEWLTRIGASEGLIDSLEQESRKNIHQSIIAKHYQIKGSAITLVQQMAKVLVAAGLNSEQTFQTIADWNKRSGSSIPEYELEKWTAQAENKARDDLKWNRVPVMSKQHFKDMCSMLKIDPPYMWQSLHRSQKQTQMNIAKIIWQKSWQAIDQIRMQNQAEGEMQKRRIQHQQAIKQQQQQKEKER